MRLTLRLILVLAAGLGIVLLASGTSSGNDNSWPFLDDPDGDGWPTSVEGALGTSAGLFCSADPGAQIPPPPHFPPDVLDNDGTVTIADILEEAAQFGPVSRPSRYDLDNGDHDPDWVPDGAVNLEDIFTVSRWFGRFC